MKRKWYRKLRWKLLVSHLLIGVISVVVLLATIHFLTNVAFLRNVPFPLDSAAGQQVPGESNTLPFTDLNDQFQRTMRDALLVAAFAALEAALIVSLSVSTRIVEPLQAISAVSRRLAQGFYHERTDINSDDELAELSQSVNQLAEALEQTEQQRMALLTDVTHELRTPLATIGGYMEGLLDGVIKPDEQTFTLVLQESRRLQRLTEDLQLLSRAEAGQIPIMPRTLNLRDTMIQLYERLKPEFDAAQIDLVLITPDTLPQIQADPDRVHQILINLLNNARRYTPQGGSVTLRARPQQETVLISVEDTGIGIAAEHLPHIFERFYRVDKSRARASGGSGIGLTIARHLVYAHGGDIWVTSDGPDLGSHFHVALPSAIDVRPAPRPQATIAAEA